jgi:hypothetical protein
MSRRGIRSPSDLTEYDQWANDAERRTIDSLLRQYKGQIFGLHLWDMRTLSAEELKNVKNFEVDYAFLNKDKPKVLQLIEEYRKRGDEWDSHQTRQFLDRLSKMSIHAFYWV